MTMDFGPICSGCSRDWDDRLGYCEYCESARDVEPAVTKKPKKKKRKFKVISGGLLGRSETPLYEQLTVDLGFAPDQSADWRYTPGGTGMLEDNFS